MPGGRKHHADSILAVSLAAGKTVREAAVDAGVGERTVYRRLERTEFRDKVAGLRGQMMDHIAGRMSEAAAHAFQKLTSLLEADSEPVRLGAAKSIIDQMVRLREATEFDGRLRQMEQLCDRKLGPKR